MYVISAPYDLTNVKEFQPDSSRAHFDQNSLVLSHEYILSQVRTVRLSIVEIRG